MAISQSHIRSLIRDIIYEEKKGVIGTANMPYQTDLQIQLNDLIKKYGIEDIVNSLAQICYDNKDEKVFEKISSVRKGITKENNNPDVIL